MNRYRMAARVLFAKVQGGYARFGVVESPGAYYFIIIIKRYRQCKAGIERFTHYQPHIPIYIKKGEKGNTVRQKGCMQLRSIIRHWFCY